MENESFIEWKNLYTTELRNIWDKECKELRKAAMVMHVLKMQFAELQSTLDNQFDQFRKEFSKRTSRLSSSAPLPSINRDTTLKEAKNNCDSANKAIQSPPIKMKRFSFKSSSGLKKTAQENTPPVSGARRKIFESSDETLIIEATPEPLPKKHSRFTKLNKKVTSKSKPESSSSEEMGITEIISFINETSSNVTGINASKPVEIQKDDKTFVDKDIKKITLVEPMEVVRGKARKKLPGWACMQCKNFYECQNLPEEELIKKMNECSRHKSKYKPDDDTFDGFWDLTLNSQKN